MSKLLKSIGLISSVLFSSLTVVFAQEQITITTYYPSPYGSYNSLQVDKLGVGDNNADGLFTAADVPVTSGDAWIKGNVGIGTITPGAKLEVSYSNGGVSGRLCLGDVGHGVSWPGLANCAQLSPAGYALIQDPTGAYTLINKNSTAGYIGFRVANADKMIINQDGNVGIGTTAPSHPLSFGTALGAKIGLYDMGSGTGYGFGIQNNLLQIFCNTSGDRVGIGYGYSGSFNETLTVKGANVGIGQPSPGAKLQIEAAGSDQSTTSFYIRNSTGTSMFHIIDNGNVRIYKDPAGYNALDIGGSVAIGSYAGSAGPAQGLIVSGRVGIGVSGPSCSLEVSGTVKASGYATGAFTGTSGSFTTVDGKTVTVTNGLITSIT